MEEYLTIVFSNGEPVTRRKEDIIFSGTDKRPRLEPEGRTIIVNWDNVLYVRKPKEHELQGCKLSDSYANGGRN